MSIKYLYEPKGVCSRAIEIDITDDEIIENVKFTGGCGGNTQGIERLVAGMKAGDAIERIKGILCGAKPTSCPDQLATALEEALESLKDGNEVSAKA